MKIGVSTGYLEDYWKGWPFEGKQMGGSERIVTELAAALAAQHHQVTVRLPRDADDRVWRGVRWRGHHAPSEQYDLLFCFDDYDRRDNGVRTALVACRSDAPLHVNFDELIFLSKTHAQLMGHPGRPAVGGGVNLEDYKTPLKRSPGLVICTSSPDRCPQARRIGSAVQGRFIHTYRTVMGEGHEYTREDLVRIQQQAMAHIYPLDPVRPSDFFSMSVLESLAAGTPVIVSDADAMPELWDGAAIVLPRPIDLGQWVEVVDELMIDMDIWKTRSWAGRERAKQYDWSVVALRYLRAACG